MLDLIISIKHKAQLRMKGMSLVLHVFSRKPKYWTDEKKLSWWWSKMKSQRIIKVIAIYPVMTINACTKFQGHPFHCFWDISVSTNITIHGEKSKLKICICSKDVHVHYKVMQVCLFTPQKIMQQTNTIWLKRRRSGQRLKNTVGSVTQTWSVD